MNKTDDQLERRLRGLATQAELVPLPSGPADPGGERSPSPSPARNVGPLWHRDHRGGQRRCTVAERIVDGRACIEERIP